LVAITLAANYEGQHEGIEFQPIIYVMGTRKEWGPGIGMQWVIPSETHAAAHYVLDGPNPGNFPNTTMHEMGPCECFAYHQGFHTNSSSLEREAHSGG
jgi:hypothetical protein